MTLTEQRCEARRELARRTMRYASWICDEHLPPALARHRLDAQRAMVATLERLAAAEMWARWQSG